MTESEAKARLLSRCGGTLRTWFRTSDDPPVPDEAAIDAVLDDAIDEGLVAVGVGAVDLVTVAIRPRFLDTAELRCLESALGNAAEPDEEEDDSKLEWARLRESLEKTVARKLARVRAVYETVPVDNTLTVGTIGLNFQETGPDATAFE